MALSLKVLINTFSDVTQDITDNKTYPANLTALSNYRQNASYVHIKWKYWYPYNLHLKNSSWIELFTMIFRNRVYLIMHEFAWTRIHETLPTFLCLTLTLKHCEKDPTANKMESNRHRIKTSSDWAGVFSIPRSLDTTSSSVSSSSYYNRHYYNSATNPSTPPTERRNAHLSATDYYSSPYVR